MIPVYYYTDVQGTGLAFIVMADVFTKVATTSQIKIESSALESHCWCCILSYAASYLISWHYRSLGRPSGLASSSACFSLLAWDLRLGSWRCNNKCQWCVLSFIFLDLISTNLIFKNISYSIYYDKSWNFVLQGVLSTLFDQPSLKNVKKPILVAIIAVFCFW